MADGLHQSSAGGRLTETEADETHGGLVLPVSRGKCSLGAHCARGRLRGRQLTACPRVERTVGGEWATRRSLTKPQSVVEIPCIFAQRLG
jgi:hypothetical protein